MKKYEMTSETIKRNGKTLHRIKALRDFGEVKKGDLGGYIEKEENLSHEGKAWVCDNAKVYDDAKVYGNAWVCGDIKEKEPAPSANDTSSKENISCINDSTNKRICQAFEQANRACQNILESYANMSDEEQKAFDLGEIYRDMLTVKDELEELKAGEE